MNQGNAGDRDRDRAFSAARQALRWLSLVGLAIWIGGFTFYSALVVPVLHEKLRSVEAGSITRRVTDRLNLVGVGALSVCGLEVLADRSARSRRARFGFLAATTLMLGFLFVLHRIMDARLDSGDLRGFYPLHRAYLIVSTAQWLLNLGLFTLLARGPGR